MVIAVFISDSSNLKLICMECVSIIRDGKIKVKDSTVHLKILEQRFCCRSSQDDGQPWEQSKEVT